MIGILKWAVIFCLCIFYGILTGSYVTLVSGAPNLCEHWITVHQAECFFFTLFFIFSAICFHRQLRKQGRDTKGHVRYALVLVLAVFLHMNLRDEPFVKGKYNWEDVSVPEKNALESYRIIADNFDHNDPKIDIDLSDIDMEEAMSNPLEHEDAILGKWESITKARHIIDQLNEFNEIADLSEPSEAIDINFMEFEFIARIYRAYALLTLEKDESIEGIRELNKIHSIAGKALPCARYLVHKLVWMVIAERNIQTAYLIACRSDSGSIALAELEKGFKPLRKKDISYRTAYISEYFFIMKEADADLDDTDEIINDICFSIFSLGICDSVVDRLYLKLVLPIILRKNMTMNNVTKQFDLLINGATNHPPEFDNKTLSRLNKPNFQNSGGWIFLNCSAADFTFYPIKAARTKVLSDILAIYLGKKTGNRAVITDDYIAGGKYVETSDPFLYKSRGFDRKINTEDDVSFQP